MRMILIKGFMTTKRVKITQVADRVVPQQDDK